jgi:hypothetical protein
MHPTILMGKQSITHPTRSSCAPLRIASLLLLCLASAVTAPAQTPTVSALTVPLLLPSAIVFDAAGNLYVAETGHHVIRKVDTLGNLTTIAGTTTQGFSGDAGPAISATLDSPQGLALDTANNLYIADTHNHRIRRIDTTGIITTVAGNGTQGFSGDTSAATYASLALPHGLSLDASGNLYLADTGNHRIRRIDATTGIITTIAGDGTQGFSGDNGPAIASSLDSPTATTLTPANLLTLSDTGNQRIRQLTAQPASSTTINTIAGLGLTTPAALTLSAPSAIAYGTGQLTASLSTTPATGSITFIETTNATTKTLGIAPIISNTATLSTAPIPAGVHTLSATYTGDQTHLPAQSPIVTLTINPAPTLITLGNSVANTAGSSIILTAHVASTTTGIPTGSVTLLDDASPLSTTPLSAAGDVTFALNSLAQGSHTFTGTYDRSTNFTPSTSAPQQIAIGTGPPTTSDFALSATGTTTQTIVSGSSATFTFAAQTQGNLFSPITLAASGLPNLATASFNPVYLPPGATPSTFTLTIATPKTTALEHPPSNNHKRLPPSATWAFLLCPSQRWRIDFKRIIPQQN